MTTTLSMCWKRKQSPVNEVLQLLITTKCFFIRSPFSAKAVEQCRCGAASCRGILGPKSKERKASPGSDLSKVKSAKRKVQEPEAKAGVAAAAAATAATSATKRRRAASTSSSRTARSQPPPKQRATTTPAAAQRPKKARAAARPATKAGKVSFVRLKHVARGVKNRGRSIAQRASALNKGGKRPSPTPTPTPTTKTPRPRSRKTEPTIAQGVARSVRVRKPVSLPPSMGLFENNSTIRLI